MLAIGSLVGLLLHTTAPPARSRRALLPREPIHLLILVPLYHHPFAMNNHTVRLYLATSDSHAAFAVRALLLLPLRDCVL